MEGMDLDFTLTDVKQLLVQMDIAPTSAAAASSALPAVPQRSEGPTENFSQVAVNTARRLDPRMVPEISTGEGPPGASNEAASASEATFAEVPGPTTEGPIMSPNAHVSSNFRVLRDLCVHGEAWKLGGSSQWRVLSDARLKQVTGDFRQGLSTLRHIAPRRFRYHGQGAHETPHVGVIAQEIPEELAPHCRFPAPLAPPVGVALPPPPGGAHEAHAPPHAPRPHPAARAATVDAVRLPHVRDLSAADRAAVARWVAARAQLEDTELEGHAQGVEVQAQAQVEAAEGAAGAAAPREDGGCAEALPPACAEGPLYLVDLSPLQFVLLNAAVELRGELEQQQAQISALRETVLSSEH